MKVDLLGRIQNVDLPPTKSLHPIFEAIINSIQAIEELGNINDSFINMYIERDETQQKLDVDEKRLGPIKSVIVEDNGIGFTEENFNAFLTSDTRKKISEGGKGIGRFLWLKAFEYVEVESNYYENGNWFERKFKFDLDDGGIKNGRAIITEGKKRITKVKLVNFKEEYANESLKKIEKIAFRFIEHCISYFILKTAPKIIVIDSSTSDKFNINDNLVTILRNKIDSSFFIDNENFKISLIKLYDTSEIKRHTIYFCANGREVLNLNMETLISNLTHKLVDESNNPFICLAYISGEYLDKNVSQERTRFTIMEERPENEIQFKEVTMKDLKIAVVKKIQEMLDKYLQPIKKEKMEMIEKFIKEKSPQYRPILKYKISELDKISPNINEENLDIELHKIKNDLLVESKEKTNKILKKEITDIKELPEYKKEYQETIETVNDVGKSNLIEYIIHRRLILQLLENTLKINKDGKYKLEEDVHKIVFPLRSTSDEITYENQNLWIIDEKLSYHYLLASDIPLNKIDQIDSESQQRPDILIFNNPIAFIDDSPPFSSVVIIEFKRPEKNEYQDDYNPISQVNNYIREIKEGSKKDKNGRTINVKSNTPFYAYIICDKTKKIDQYAIDYGFIKTPDEMGYFNYNPGLQAYTEIISYTKLLEDSKKRNRVLFEKLNLT